MNEVHTVDPYEELGNAIILQAVKDYRRAIRRLAKGRRNKEAQIMKKDCLTFFHSGWYEMLTQVDPDYLIRKLDEEVRYL